MKKLIATTIAGLALAMPMLPRAEDTPHFDKTSYCEKLGEVGGEIVDSRYRGVPKYKLVNAVKNGPDSFPYKNLTLEMIDYVYKDEGSWRHRGDIMQLLYDTCMKGMGTDEDWS